MKAKPLFNESYESRLAVANGFLKLLTAMKLSGFGDTWCALKLL